MSIDDLVAPRAERRSGSETDDLRFGLPRSRCSARISPTVCMRGNALLTFGANPPAFSLAPIAIRIDPRERKPRDRARAMRLAGNDGNDTRGLSYLLGTQLVFEFLPRAARMTSCADCSDSPSPRECSPPTGSDRLSVGGIVGEREVELGSADEDRAQVATYDRSASPVTRSRASYGKLDAVSHPGPGGTASSPARIRSSPRRRWTPCRRRAPRALRCEARDDVHLAPRRVSTALDARGIYAS